MSTGDSNYEAENLASAARRDLLSSAKVLHLQERISELKDVMCTLELIGNEEQRTTAIASFHLLKGKIDAFQELLADHSEAQDLLSELSRVQDGATPV